MSKTLNYWVSSLILKKLKYYEYAHRFGLIKEFVTLNYFNLLMHLSNDTNDEWT
jgi:hypothetical protein